MLTFSKQPGQNVLATKIVFNLKGGSSKFTKVCDGK